MTETQFDLLMAKACSEGLFKEEDEDKDEDDDDSCSEPEYDPFQNRTNFMMLLESCTGFSCVEVCMELGVIEKNAYCSNCFIPMSMRVLVLDPLDKGCWQCVQCDATKSLREGSWFEDMEEIPLADILFICYFWTQEYTERACKNELKHAEENHIQLVYNKCNKLCSDYFKNEVCSIGSERKIVDIEKFTTAAGIHVIGGVERKDKGKVFFRVLPESYGADDVVTAIVDNTVSGTTLHIQNPSLLGVLGDKGLNYLVTDWDHEIKTYRVPDNPMVTFLRSLFQENFNDKHFTESSINEFLFRLRMDSSEDPYLHFFDAIKHVYPPSVTEDEG